MNLFAKKNIIKMYPINDKKSIYFSERFDLFIVLSLLVFIITSVIFNLVYSPYLRNNKKHAEIFLSPHFEGLFGKGMTETLLREFEELYPDLQVRLLNTSVHPFEIDHFRTARKNSSPDEKSREPDILIFDEGEFNSLVAGNALLSLEHYSDERRAIPLVFFMDVLFFNIDLLTTAGFDRPPKTREDFISFAGAVSGSSNSASGTAISLSPSDKIAVSRDIFSWIWASGNDFWLGEYAPVFNSRSIIRDITFLGSLNREGVLLPRGFFLTENQILEEFARGNIAMMIASTRAIPALREKMGDDVFGITTIPGSGFGGKYSLSLSGIYAGINAGCAYPDAAWKFIAFLAERTSSFCAELKAIPGDVSNLFLGEYIKDDPFYSKAQDIFESSVIIRGFSGKPQAEEYENVVREEFQLFFETGRTAEQTAAAIQRRWDEITNHARPH